MPRGIRIGFAAAHKLSAECGFYAAAGWPATLIPAPAEETLGWDFTGLKTLPSSSVDSSYSHDLSQYAIVPMAATPVYTKLSGNSSITVNPATGMLNKTVGLAAGTYDVVVELLIPETVTLLTTLYINGGGAGKPWTAGHVFKQEDIPPNRYPGVVGAENYQYKILNYWPDGSVKFAILSGIGGISLDVVSSTATNPVLGGVEAITSEDVGATSVTLSGIGTVNLADAINGADLSSFVGTKAVKPANAGRLRVHTTGPVMREEHFYSPIGAYLAVFWYVRKYSSGDVEVETVIENGWQYVTGGAGVSYIATIIVNGVTRYTSPTTSHLARSRWSRADWVGIDPGTIPGPSTSYLMGTKLVPNYGGFGPPSAATLDAQAAIVSTPFARGQFPSAMGTEGYHMSIGILPGWDAMYITSGGDVRAFSGLISMARNAGRYGLYMRNEATLALDYNADPEAHYVDGPSPFPSMGGAGTPEFKPTHHPSMGFFAYLLTGRYVFFETCLAVEIGLYLRHDFQSRRGGNRGLVYQGNESRAYAWKWRSNAQAAFIAPDGSAIKTAIQFRWHENMIAYGKFWSGDSTHGIPASGGGTSTGHLTALNSLGCVSSMEASMLDQLWMHQFTSAALGYTWDIEPASDSTARGWHLVLRDKSYDLAKVFALPPNNNYRFSLAYRPWWGTQTSPRTWFSNWRAVMDTFLEHNVTYQADKNLTSVGAALHNVPQFVPVTMVGGSVNELYCDDTNLTGFIGVNVVGGPLGGPLYTGVCTDAVLVGNDTYLTVSWVSGTPLSVTNLKRDIPLTPESTSSYFNGYAANAQASIAYASEHGNTGGVLAWSLYSTSSNYIGGAPSYSNAPQFGIIPR